MKRKTIKYIIFVPRFSLYGTVATTVLHYTESLQDEEAHVRERAHNRILPQVPANVRRGLTDIITIIITIALTRSRHARR